MTPASYARFSTDKQRPTSIEDQERVNFAYCERHGWPAPILFSDGAMSASLPVVARPGAAAMLDAAIAGRFDVLVVEALDRMFRDIAEQERTVRRLEFLGVRIIGITDGYDSESENREMYRGIRGLFNQQQLRDIAKKTHRGLSGQITRGFVASAAPYGYRIDREDQGSRYSIVPAQAEWVRHIFAEFASGKSTQVIASDLNIRQAPSPRGGTWAQSAIYGSPAKGSGILNNSLYVGELVWNRSKWVKDPETGKRERRMRPEGEWQVSHHPELRIVDDGLWRAVRKRLARPVVEGGRQGRAKRPSSLFGGLLRCANCGGAMVVVDALNYGCAARKDRGASVCPGMRVRRDVVDKRMLGAIREQLLSPESLILFRSEIAVMAKELNAPGGAFELRARALEREVARLVEAITMVGASPALAARLKAAEAEHAEVAAALATVPEVEKSPEELMADYKEALMNLGAALDGDDIEVAREFLREAFGEIKVSKLGEEIWAETSSSPAAIAASGGLKIGMVAGTGYPFNLRFRCK